MFLTKEELQALTGRQRRDAQVAALRPAQTRKGGAIE